jgi:tetratricopeptide (TPR) repeat protein
MTLKDCRGIPVSTTHTAALQAYEEGVELTASYFLDPMAKVQAALDLEPRFAAGHCLRAALMITSTDRNTTPFLADSVEAIESLGRRANERERAHAAAARTWLEGDFAGAIRRYGDILLDYPRDLLALQVAHVGDFFLGASSMLRDRLAQVVPAWDASVPGFNYVLGMYAFGLEETALYSRAEDAGRRALEINRRDPWAIHAVAHVMEMQGRVRDGIEWLSSREQDWAPNNGFAFHNWWHLALFNLDAGEIEPVLALYDRAIRPARSAVPLEMIDAAALLWRLSLRGVDVGARWERIAEDWQPFVEQGYYAFNDVHAVMAFVGAQRFDLAQATIGALERAAIEKGTNGAMSREVGLPLAHGLVSFGLAHYEEALDVLLPIRTIAHRFGGSHAQRDLIHLTLVEAALRSGKDKLARALISERTQLKPTSPSNWQLTARSMELSSDTAGAIKARETAEARRRAQLGAPRAVA